MLPFVGQAETLGQEGQEAKPLDPRTALLELKTLTLPGEDRNRRGFELVQPFRMLSVDRGCNRRSGTVRVTRPKERPKIHVFVVGSRREMPYRNCPEAGLTAITEPPSPGPKEPRLPDPRQGRRRPRRTVWILVGATTLLLSSFGLIKVHVIDLDVVRASVLSRIAGVYPDRANAYEFLRSHYSAAGRSKDAVDACEKLVQIKPEDPRARSLLGDAYREVSRPQEAIACYREALKLDPNCYEAYLGLGRVYVAMNLHAEALESYRQAVRIRPGSAPAHVALGLALSNLGRYEEAMKAFEQAKELDPAVSETQVLSGKAYLEAGLGLEAIECFRSVILIDQGHAQAHFNLGRAYLSIGDVDLALREQRILQRLDADLAARLHGLIHR